MKVRVQGGQIDTKSSQARVMWVAMESENLDDAVQLGRISAKVNRAIVKAGSEFHVELSFSELITLAAK